MLHHRTTDPGERAADIAEHEAERAWRATRDFGVWSSTWETTYNNALREFAGKEEPDDDQG